MNENQKKFINLCSWSAVIAFALRCFFSWDKIVAGTSLYEYFGIASEAVGIAALFVIGYEQFLWRLNPLETMPKLAKKYTGKIKSSYDNSERIATLTIKQTLLSVRVFMATEESKSKSMVASINDVLGDPQLVYCYLNTPKSEHRDRSQIHYGTATLAVVNPECIDGQYYTDRKTTGDMFFVKEK